MRIRYEAAAAIQRPADEVFDYLADINRWPEWAHGVLVNRLVSAGPLAVGSRIWQRNKTLGPAIERTLSVVTLAPGQSLAFEGSIGSSPMRFGHDVRPAADGTQLTAWVEVDLRGFMLLAAPVFPRVLRGGVDRDLRTIHANLELGARPSTGRMAAAVDRV